MGPRAAARIRQDPRAMVRNQSLLMDIDLGRIRDQVVAIGRQTGVEVLPVLKADAYGLGARRIRDALAGVAKETCYFSLAEAESAGVGTHRGHRALILGPCTGAPVDRYRDAHARPAVTSMEHATRYRSLDPALCVDTGMQRFAAHLDEARRILDQGLVQEVFTHAVSWDQVNILIRLGHDRGCRLHAASSALLGHQGAALDAVRPGLALYRNALRVSTSLVECHRSRGPVGYSGFRSDWHGVIQAGYRDGLRPGPCLIDGRPSRILEVGMQSAYVETRDGDRPGADVVLLGNGIGLEEVGAIWGCPPHAVLVAMAGAAHRRYRT